MLLKQDRQPGLLYRHKRAATAGIATLSALSLWTVFHLPSGGVAEAQDVVLGKQIDAAIEATAQEVLANSACPPDLASVQELVSELWPMLYPEVANQVLEGDPAYVQAQQTAAWQMEHAKELDAELLKDGSVQLHRAETLRAFTQGMLSPKEAEEKVIRQAQRLRQLGTTADSAGEAVTP
jgi:hypothetical protein